jgi:microcystin-dependent protein
MADPFIGEIRMFGFAWAPRDWAYCNGAIAPISQNQALFAIIGTYYGGDGRTTMGLPNLESRAPISWGRGPGLTNYRMADWGGYESYQLSESQLPGHTHSPVKAAIDADSPDPASNLYLGRKTGGDLYTRTDPKTPGQTPVPMNTSFVSVAGQSFAHENRQPSLALNFCISLSGYFPPRN